MIGGALIALTGAVVGFGGSYLLQWQRFRRERLHRWTYLIGAVRVLRSELLQAHNRVKSAQERDAVVGLMGMPIAGWQQHGAAVLAAVEGEWPEQVSRAFSWISASTGLLDGMDFDRVAAMSAKELDLTPQLDAILAALDVLDQVEVELRTRLADAGGGLPGYSRAVPRT